MAWSGPKGGQIGVGFDDGHFGPEQMRAQIDSVREAYPDLPELPWLSLVVAIVATVLAAGIVVLVLSSPMTPGDIGQLLPFHEEVLMSVEPKVSSA